jgi:hypothetical protein
MSKQGVEFRRMGDAVVVTICEMDIYACAYRAAYGAPIGEDGYIGDAWRDILKGLVALLNGELGQHDGGTLDRRIRTIATRHGVNGDDL